MDKDKKPKIDFKGIDVGYLYPDGHAVLVFKKTDKKTGVEIKWIEVVQYFAEISGYHKFDDGRMILDKGLVPLVYRARELNLYKNNHTQKTKDLGITMHSLTVHLKEGVFHVHDMSSIMSGEFTLQDSPTYAEKFDPNLKTWGHDCSPVVKVHKKDAPVAV